MPQYVIGRRTLMGIAQQLAIVIGILGLQKWLTSAVGESPHVMPGVALPGWFVERTGRGDVRVFSGKELAGLLTARGAQALRTQEVQRVAHQVEQRCRTVAPRYADEVHAS